MDSTHQFCQQCGTELDGDGRFCGNCGAPVPLSAHLIPEASFVWDFDIPMLSPFILRGVATAFGIPLFLLFCLFGYFAIRSDRGFMKTLEDNATGIYFTAILLGLLIGLTILVLAVVYKGKYAAQFTLDAYGASFETRNEQRKINTVVNMLLIVMGLLSGKPGSIGTGLLAQSSQSGAVEWKEVHRITPYPKRHAIVLHNWWRKALVLYCTADNYEPVLRMTEQAVAQTATIRAQEFTATKKYLSTVLTWLPVVIILTFLAAASPLLDNFLTIGIMGTLCAIALFCGGPVQRFLGFMSLFAWLGNIALMVFNAMQVHTFVRGLVKVSHFTSVLQHDSIPLAVSLIGMFGLLAYIRRTILLSKQPDAQNSRES